MTFEHQYAAPINFYDPTWVDNVSAFSSRGPRRGDSFLKPDITAPSDSVFSAYNGTGVQGVAFGDTSMAAPHVTGGMALLRQAYPSWTVEALKAVAMNTALDPLRNGLPIPSTLFGPARVGAGRIDLPDAFKANAVAYNAGTPGVVSLSYGAPEVATTATMVRRIKVVNKTALTVNYTVTYASAVTMTGVSYAVAPGSIYLPPFGVATVAVTMMANASQMKHIFDPSLDSQDTFNDRQTLGESSGYVNFFNVGMGRLELHVPVHAAPCLVSSMMSAPGTALTFTGGVTTNVVLTGTGVQTGAPFAAMLNITSLVTALELQYQNPDLPATGRPASAPLKNVGVMSAFKPQGSIANTEIFFGISTFGNWSTPTGCAGDASLCFVAGYHQYRQLGRRC